MLPLLFFHLPLQLQHMHIFDFEHSSFLVFAQMFFREHFFNGWFCRVEGPAQANTAPLTSPYLKRYRSKPLIAMRLLLMLYNLHQSIEFASA